MSPTSYQTALPRVLMGGIMDGKSDCQIYLLGEHSGMPSILFVCLGNICRSPMAESVAAGLIASRPDAKQWLLDSAGTGDWHVGNPPDHRTVAVLKARGLPTGHKARQVRPDDFTAFTYVLAMDRSNVRNLAAFMPESPTATVKLLGDYDPLGVAEVPDPYHDGPREFEAVHQQVERCLRAFFAQHPVGQG